MSSIQGERHLRGSAAGAGSWTGSGALHRVHRVRDAHEVARDTRLVVLDAALECRAGQFVLVWVPGLDEKPFCAADDDPLALVVRNVGPVTGELFGLHPGDRLWVRGPLGSPFAVQSGRALLVAGGYGAAPLGLLCRTCHRAGVEAHLVVGARTAADLVIPPLASRFAARVHLATEDGSRGTRGRATELTGTLLGPGGFSHVYACGPNAMLEALREVCRGAGIPLQASYERYMRCGVGICGSCELDGRLVCRDGPVFRFGPGGEAA